MIVICLKCGCSYNNETTPYCPLCNLGKKKKKKRRRKISEKSRNNKALIREIKDFVRRDCSDKKRTATGYQHKMKTGKNTNV